MEQRVVLSVYYSAVKGYVQLGKRHGNRVCTKSPQGESCKQALRGCGC